MELIKVTVLDKVPLVYIAQIYIYGNGESKRRSNKIQKIYNERMGIGDLFMTKRLREK